MQQNYQASAECAGLVVEKTTLPEACSVVIISMALCVAAGGEGSTGSQREKGPVNQLLFEATDQNPHGGGEQGLQTVLQLQESRGYASWGGGNITCNVHLGFVWNLEYFIYCHSTIL